MHESYLVVCFISKQMNGQTFITDIVTGDKYCEITEKNFASRAHRRHMVKKYFRI